MMNSRTDPSSSSAGAGVGVLQYHHQQQQQQQAPSATTAGMLPMSNSIADYPVPDILRLSSSKKKGLLKSDKDGMLVWKVSKSGDVQSRRVAISHDHRKLLITSRKVKSVKGLIQQAVTGSSGSAPAASSLQEIVLPFVDRIDHGGNGSAMMSERLLYLEKHIKSSSYRTKDSETAGWTEAQEVALTCLEIGQYITIVYNHHQGSDHSHIETTHTLDFIIPDKSEFQLLVSTLDDLVTLGKRELQNYSSVHQWFQYHMMVSLGKDWYSDDNDANQMMTQNEWITLNDKIQCPLKKNVLMQLYKDALPTHATDKQQTPQLLSVSDVAQLLEHKVKPMCNNSDPMQRLWKELVDTDPVPSSSTSNNNEISISSVALLSFIRSQQKNYSVTLEEVIEFVDTKTMNQWQTGSVEEYVDKNNKKMDRMSQSRFLSWMLSNDNDIMDPNQCQVGVDDMTKPLTHYWIQSSHDTYIQHSADSFHGRSAFAAAKKTSGPTTCNAYMYTAALQRGVRCLEIDVWDHPTAGTGSSHDEPVVARTLNIKNHNNAVADDNNNFVLLRTVLRCIRHFLNQNPYCFPIILKLENLCTPPYQLKISNLLYEYFGAANLIVTPPEGQPLHHTKNVHLPSPESARGKIIIIGKRPKRVRVGCTVINDDLDDENDGRKTLAPAFVKYLEEYNDDQSDDQDAYHGVVVGFDTKGPIRSKELTVLHRSPEELLDMARADVRRAEIEKEEALYLKHDLSVKADEQEALAAKLTQDAGMQPDEVKRRAARAASRGGDAQEQAAADNDTRLKEEGVEVHEIMPIVVEGNRDAYAEAAQESMEAANNVSRCFSQVREAENSLERAEKDLEMSRALEQKAIDNASRAAADARFHQEHANAAHERVDKVRGLLRNREVDASSAGTVVQTALTEARISEKRAAEAQTRATRSRNAAEKDRARAEDETRKEEEMEQEVSDLLITCQEASEMAQATKAQLDKANSMLERINEQIKLIEKSTQFRKELDESGESSVSGARHGGSFLGKHDAKVQERKMCRGVIKNIAEEHTAAETRLHLMKGKYEDRANALKAQANVAAQARRSADRSMRLAEELEEQAEEEREAAKLRHVAKEKAEEAVENRGSHRESVEAQLAEAERAAAEAAAISQQSRNRAHKLEQEVTKFKDHSNFMHAVMKRKNDLKQALGAYEAAKEEQQKKDDITATEKHRLDTNSSVYQAAARDAATEVDRIRVIQVLQQEAIVAYNTALMLRAQSDDANVKADIAVSVTEAKNQAAAYARGYKEKRDMLIEIPVALAKTTLVHTSRFLDWERTLSLPNTVAQSFAQNVLLQRVDRDPESERMNFQAYTKDHLCRAFPPWRAMMSKPFSNCDPVFAWSLGCQLVSMNFHSADENLLVADGRFRQNGSCGYVLKPSYLTDNSAKMETEEIWIFNILGAYNLPKMGRKTVKPRVRVSLYAGSTKETRIMYKTKVAEPNGLNPSWPDNKGGYTFKVSVPSVAIVSFSVWDVQDERTETFVAGSAVPMSCLRQGYRSVALFSGDHSRTGPMCYASLLVRATKR